MSSDRTTPSPGRRGLLISIRERLAEPRIRELDLDSDDLLQVQRSLLREKRMLREVFRELYRMCIELDERFFEATGPRVEIGAGASLFKETFPEILTTDVKSAPHLDRVVDAQDMPFPDNSVRAIYGIHCFHHLPDPGAFFDELTRVLGPGGGCVLVEPYHGLVAEQFYKRVFDSESFDKAQRRWTGDDGMTAMKGANQALSYIVFARDRAGFEGTWSALEIVHQERLKNYLRYLASGGLNFRPLLPEAAIPALRFLETCLVPLSGLLALHHVVVLRKRT